MDSQRCGALLARKRPIWGRDVPARTVLAATDFSALGKAAMRRAAALCADNGARMHLMHVRSRTGQRAEALMRGVAERGWLRSVPAAERLRHAAASVSDEFRISAETYLGVGGVVPEVTAHAKRVSADLAVLGNSKCDFLSEVLGFNRALRVQRSSGLPVLAVSEPHRLAYTRILVATELSADGAHAARQALRFFPNSELVILHAFESPYSSGMPGVSSETARDYKIRAYDEGMQRLRGFVRNESLDHAAMLRVHLGHPALAARREAYHMGADLIVVRETGRWITNGVIEHLIADPPCDLLLMP